MSFIYHFVFGKPIHDSVKEHEEFLTKTLGKNNASYVRKAESVNRCALYQAAYQNIHDFVDSFKELKAGHLWLQDQHYGSTGALRNRIVANGGAPSHDFCLMWAEAPGKIYCAYPVEDESVFFVERFFPTDSDAGNFSGIVERVALDRLQEMVKAYVNRTHDENLWKEEVEVLRDPALEESMKPFVKLLNEMNGVRSEISQNKAVLRTLRPGKKTRKEIDNLKGKIEAGEKKLAEKQKKYGALLQEKGLGDANCDKTGLSQRWELNNLAVKLQSVERELEALKEQRAAHHKESKSYKSFNAAIGKVEESLQSLKSQYFAAFDALV